MTAENIATFIRQHDLPARIVESGIETLDRFVNIKTRTYHEQVIVLPANIQTVRDWLGY